MFQFLQNWNITRTGTLDENLHAFLRSKVTGWKFSHWEFCDHLQRSNFKFRRKRQIRHTKRAFPALSLNLHIVIFGHYFKKLICILLKCLHKVLDSQKINSVNRIFSVVET